MVTPVITIEPPASFSEDADAADTTADDSETETADKSEEADDTNVADDKAAETADSTTDADSADAK